MSEISIQSAEAADIPSLQILFSEYGYHLAHNATAAANICIENFDREIAALPAPYFALLLAAVDGARAGCVALRSLARPGEQACEMKRLWVSTAHRGLGLGRKLILTALDHARSTGHTTMYLDTVPAAMPEANRLYASLGFEEVSRYNPNPVPNVVFFRRFL